MNSMDDVKDPDMCQMWRFRGVSQCVSTKICEKLHEIACFLTCLTYRTQPVGRVTPHTYLDLYYITKLQYEVQTPSPMYLWYPQLVQ